MPAHRDPDTGEIIEIKTVKAGDTPTGNQGAGHSGGGAAPPPKPSAGNSAYEAKTIKIGSSRGTAALQGDDEPKTRVFRRSNKAKVAASEPAPTVAASDSSQESAAMDDPPAGWLVVVEGPGQGNFVTIRLGSNSIGRDPSERICLNFGDESISRTQHAVVTYDPRGKKFFVHHGGGKNLTYLNDEPVLTPTMLEPHAHIQIADTVLRFVPLCGDAFDWDSDD